MLNSVGTGTRPHAEPPLGQAAIAKRDGLGFELPLLAGLLAFLAFAYAQPDAIEPATANIVAALSLIAILALGCRRLLRIDPMAIWSPLLWMRVACAAYYGFGALVPYIANNATLVQIQSLYMFTDIDVLKTNIIDVASILCIFIGVRLAELHLQGRRTGSRHQDATGSLELFTVIFLIAGGIARYVFVLPFLLGFGEGFVPSIAIAAARAYSAGLMLLIIVGLRGNRLLLLLAAALVGLELFVGVLSFSKSEVLVTILFVLLAVYHQRPSLLRLGLGAALAIAVFASLQPMIGYGRERTIELGAGQQIATLEDRWSIFTSYLRGDQRMKAGEEEAQGAMSRFSYVNAATMVVAWYDLGRSGSTFENALAVFVPRLLWPDKPDISASGRELATEATGNVGTSISPGLPAEAYWNFGWWGIPLLMLPFGVVLAVLAHASTRIMAQERWLYLPVVLMSIQMGTRVDGSYVGDCIGTPVSVAILYSLMRGAEIILFSRGARN